MLEPHLLVIFGGTGDLGRRKLFPALIRLLSERGWEQQCQVLGVATKPLSDHEYREWVLASTREVGMAFGKLAEWCERSVHYQQIGKDPASFAELRDRVQSLDAANQLGGRRVFYLAVPPSVIGSTIASLGTSGLNRSEGWTRIVVEKPFGHDLESARELNRLLHKFFAEEDIYRIDHYLGKQTVQNLLVFRFANALFEEAWNRHQVRSVQITVSESLGVEGRAGFYEQAGAMRDIVQNHMVQLLSLVAMEPPVRFNPEAIRDEKVKVLRSIAGFRPELAVYGQYGTGDVPGAGRVVGYREEPGVSPTSQVETSISLRVAIDNWRWQGVPFYLRTGKRYPRRLTQIAVTFQQPPIRLFEAEEMRPAQPNVLLITLQPDEGFSLFFDVKVPAEQLQVETFPLQFRYKESFGPIPDSYETLMGDIMTGDQTLFVRGDEVEEAWRICAPLIDPTRPRQIHTYPAGSWGPEQADALFPAGETWFSR